MILVAGLAIWVIGVGTIMMASMLDRDIREAFMLILTAGTEQDQRKNKHLLLLAIFFWPLVIVVAILDEYINRNNPGPPTGW